jgi:hypothetical protein
MYVEWCDIAAMRSKAPVTSSRASPYNVPMYVCTYVVITYMYLCTINIICIRILKN